MAQRRFGGDNVGVPLVSDGAVAEGAAPSSGGGGVAANQASGKRKRGGGGGGGSGKGRASRKSKSGASTSVSNAAAGSVKGTTVGKHIVGSPFAVEVRPISVVTNWVFGSIPADNRYRLSEGGAVVTQVTDAADYIWRGAVADGAGCSPMTSGVHFWELEHVKHGADSDWCFGVCRPGIDLNNDDEHFIRRDDTWLMYQRNAPVWYLSCNTCKGTGMTLDPKPKIPEGSRIGLLLDLDNGGTLTMYVKNKPCGSIAAGLAGPLLPCISSFDKGKVVKIHGGLAPPPLAEGAVPQLEAPLNGKRAVGSLFAVEVRPISVVTNWVFGSIAADNRYELSDGGTVVTTTKEAPGGTWRGAIADDAGCNPMISGVHFWELELVKHVDYSDWCFGVCRPGIDLDDGNYFIHRADTWMMRHANHPYWGLRCNTCAGTGLTLDPQPQMPDGSRIGLLLDLDNGGTLTMYLDNKPCGTIAEGLVGPLLPCIALPWEGMVIKIHGGLAPPPLPPQHWVFGSIPADNRYRLSEGGAVVTYVKDHNRTYRGTIADGAGCTPMISGVHFWELEHVKHGADSEWMFGVCRPGIDLNNDDEHFSRRDDTWLMYQRNTPVWYLSCNTCKGTGMTLDPKPKIPEGSRIGLLLDLDNGGTLTMYLDNKPCGTIAAGLAGPLVPCISSWNKGMVVKIHGGLAPPQGRHIQRSSQRNAVFPGGAAIDAQNVLGTTVDNTDGGAVAKRASTQIEPKVARRYSERIKRKGVDADSDNEVEFIEHNVGGGGGKELELQQLTSKQAEQIERQKQTYNNRPIRIYRRRNADLINGPGQLERDCPFCNFSKQFYDCGECNSISCESPGCDQTYKYCARCLKPFLTAKLKAACKEAREYLDNSVKSSDYESLSRMARILAHQENQQYKRLEAIETWVKEGNLHLRCSRQEVGASAPPRTRANAKVPDTVQGGNAEDPIVIDE